MEQAQGAGAAALVISSPAYEPGAVRRPTLLDPDGIEIPAMYASNEVGEALRQAAAAGGSVHLTVQTLNEERETANVIGERLGSGPGATPDQVIMIGGHLDSVIDGPGINDNGSGTMTILELAERLADLGPTPRTVRFAFWTGEELGLFGSEHWVQQQNEDSLHAIVAYLNFDMVASSNYSRLVYDSSSAVADSRPITVAFEEYFDAVGLSYEALDLGASSDHYPFDQALVPSGGLFSGASEVKTDEEEQLFGGTAGAAHGPVLSPGLRRARPDQRHRPGRVLRCRRPRPDAPPPGRGRLRLRGRRGPPRCERSPRRAWCPRRTTWAHRTRSPLRRAGAAWVPFPFRSPPGQYASSHDIWMIRSLVGTTAVAPSTATRPVPARKGCIGPPTVSLPSG